MKEFSDFKFIIHEAVWYKDNIARIEKQEITKDNDKVYLIQTSNHHYLYVKENELERYIG